MLTTIQVLRTIEVEDDEFLKRPGDPKGIDLSGPPGMGRLLPDGDRPSVRAGKFTCVFPSFWFPTNSKKGKEKQFGCKSCPEQDVCPLFRATYSKRALLKGVTKDSRTLSSIMLAAEHWKVKPNFNKVVHHDDKPQPLSLPEAKRRERKKGSPAELPLEKTVVKKPSLASKFASLVKKRKKA